MMQPLFRVGTATIFILLSSAPVVAQVLPLAPMPSSGLSVTPFMEGWYENEDGSHTISFGYLNRNDDEEVRIPIGERNWIEPGEYSGMQPTVFLPGRNRGVFVATIPAGAQGVELLWTIVNANGEVHKVPGRTSSHAYELDRNPRPAGSLPPRVAFAENGPWGWDPTGIKADGALIASVGQPVVLELWVDDLSQRDPADTRTEAARTLRVVWSPHQSPPAGDIEFTRHESTPAPEVAEETAAERSRPPPPPRPQEVTLDGPGVARVYAAFDVPGEYLVRAQVDNWRAPDSSSGDQCCWSNAYFRVTVRP